MGLLFTDWDPPYKREARRSKVQEGNVITESGGEKKIDEDL